MASAPVIKVSVSRTFNLGDYENVKYEFGVEESLPDGATKSQHIKELTHRLETMLAQKDIEYGRIPE